MSVLEVAWPHNVHNILVLQILNRGEKEQKYLQPPVLPLRVIVHVPRV